MKLDRFSRYAWGVLAYNLLVIIWGAYVRASGSGAGCGSHWPLCNGSVVQRAPAMETVIELTHRATSGIALIAVLVLFVWSRKSFPRGHAVRLGATLSLIFILVEAALGAGLVLFELVADDDSNMRAFSMVAHLINTFILVAVLALTAWWASGGEKIRLKGEGRSAALIGLALLGLLAVGGTGAIAALGDTLFPSASLGEGLRDSFSSESHPFIQLRKYHPFIAIFVGLYTALIAKRLAGRNHDNPLAAPLAGIVVGLYVTQLIAGVTNMILLAPIWLQLVHLLLADLVWISVVLLGAVVLGERSPRAAYVSPTIAGARSR
jgi:heme A synthase